MAITLLQQMEADRIKEREVLRKDTLRELRVALDRLVPTESVIVFGSLVKPGRFKETSDVDLALEHEPRSMNVLQLMSLLAETLGRPVDVVLLSDCRFREKVLREGEKWTLRD